MMNINLNCDSLLIFPQMKPQTKQYNSHQEIHAIIGYDSINYCAISQF